MRIDSARPGANACNKLIVVWKGLATVWKLVVALVFATAAIVPATAQGDLAGQISACRNLRDDEARLRCYDQLAPQGGPRSSNGDNVLFQWSGTGMTTTRPFRVETPWELQWESSNLIQIYLYREGSDLPDIAANQVGAGKGSSYQPQPGEYYMKVNALGAWKVRVIAVAR